MNMRSERISRSLLRGISERIICDLTLTYGDFPSAPGGLRGASI